MSAPPPPAGYTVPPKRPLGVAILAILVILVGVFLLLAGILALLGAGLAFLGGFGFFGLVGFVAALLFLIFGLIFVGVGLGLWHLRSWAWWLAIIVLILEILGSLGSPITLILPLLIFIYLVLVRHHFR